LPGERVGDALAVAHDREDAPVALVDEPALGRQGEDGAVDCVEHDLRADHGVERGEPPGGAGLDAAVIADDVGAQFTGGALNGGQGVSGQGRIGDTLDKMRHRALHGV
jgi:hypothetical protein